MEEGYRRVRRERRTEGEKDGGRGEVKKVGRRGVGEFEGGEEREGERSEGGRKIEKKAMREEIISPHREEDNSCSYDKEYLLL